MEWMLMPYRRYFEFGGRSRRKEYWMFALLFLIVYVIAMLLSVAVGGSMDGSGGGGIMAGLVGLLLGVFLIGSFIPSLAVAIRRLHDTDRSGWWLLIGLVPIVGAFILLYFYVIEGTRGPNRFGPDPKEGEARGV